MCSKGDIECTGWAALEPGQKLVKHDFKREQVGPNDCEIDVINCGICHSDLHLNKGEFGPMSAFPKPQVIKNIVYCINIVSTFLALCIQ